VPSDFRTRKANPLGRAVDRLTKGLLGKNGFTHGALITQWPDIVGAQMAHHCQPQKIVFSRDGATGGTLHLKADSGAFATQLQHQEPQVVERVNSFFGYKAIDRIRLFQGPLPAQRGTPAGRDRQAPPPLNPAQTRQLAKTVAMVEDPDIQKALMRLGTSIRRRDKGDD